MEIQTYNNTTDACSLCLETNLDLNPLTAESQLETIYYKNILASTTIDYLDFHLSACDKCLKQLKSYQNFIKTCQSSYEFIKKMSCFISRQTEVLVKEEQEDFDLEVDVSDGNDCEETKETEQEKPEDTLDDTSKLNQHMAAHTGDTVFKCSFCDKIMQRKNDLKNHERTHTGERPYVCSICNKAFAQSIVLNQHMKLHTGQKEKCEICEKTFCRPAVLRMHMRVHTGEAPYKCSLCDKAFHTQSGCKYHMATHSDERTFICKHCGSAFKRRANLRIHEAIHTDEKPFCCQLCDFACRTSRSLKRHVKNCHS